MPGKPTSTLQKYSVPIRQSDRYVYDEAFVMMKERFAAEMRRIDEEMARLSENLPLLTGQTTTVHAGTTSSGQENQATDWEVITKSPLLQGEGEDKIMNLQFDLSAYAPDEVSVQVLNHMLIVSAQHHETKDDNTRTYTEFNREFLLPADTDPEAIESTLTKEGLLTVKAPIHIESPDCVSVCEDAN